MTDKYEKLIRWYLRFNGYFTIDNFIVHAGDDPQRISAGVVSNYTETDILGIRMPYSQERSGSLCIANHDLLTNGAEGKFDIVVAEVKSGADKSPNPAWQKKDVTFPIEYIVQFIGFYSGSDNIQNVASSLASKYSFEDSQSRIRYILFSNKVDKHWHKQGVQYITFEEVIQFLVGVRGQSWIDSGIGVASVHGQWDSSIGELFKIATDSNLKPEQKLHKISDLFE